MPFTGFSSHKETHSGELFRVDTDREREDKQLRMTGGIIFQLSGIIFQLSSAAQCKCTSLSSSDMQLLILGKT